MIVRTTQTGRGMHVILSSAEASSLVAALATGKPRDQLGHTLRRELLKQACLQLYGDAERYLHMPGCLEHADLDLGQPAIVTLIQQAQANPALRQATRLILVDAAGKLARLISKAGPACATAAQAGGLKVGN